MAGQIDVVYVKKKIIKDLFLSTIRDKVEIQAPVVRDWLFNWDSRVLLINRTWPKGCTVDMLFILCRLQHWHLQHSAEYRIETCTKWCRVHNGAVYNTPCTQRCHVHNGAVYSTVSCTTLCRVQHCAVIQHCAVYHSAPCTTLCCVQHSAVYSNVLCTTLIPVHCTTMCCVQHSSLYNNVLCTTLCCVQHSSLYNTVSCRI